MSIRITIELPKAPMGFYEDLSKLLVDYKIKESQIISKRIIENERGFKAKFKAKSK